MKLASLRTESGTALAVRDGRRLVDVPATAALQGADVLATMEELIAAGPAGQQVLADLLGGEVVTLDPGAVTFVPVVADPEKILSTASRYMTLKPGGLIFIGTPEGVICGKPQAQQDWIRPGDTVEATIEGIGTLVTHFD